MRTKLLILVLLASIFCVKTFAQTPQKATAAYRVDSTLHAYHLHSSAKKTTGGSASRLIAHASLNNSGLQDSVTYIYSGSRGGDLTHTLNYDSSFSGKYNFSPDSLTSSSLTIQTFDANNNILTSTVLPWSGVTNSYVNGDKNIYTYDGNNNELTEESQQWDSATSSWDNFYRQLITYDANNNYTAILTEGWNDSASTWDSSKLYIYTYTNANKQRTILSQQWDATLSVWKPYQLDTFTYDGNNNELTDVTLNYTVADTWANSAQSIATYDAQNNQLTWRYQLWEPGWTDFTLDNYSNFIAGQPQVDSTLGFHSLTHSLGNTSITRSTYNIDNQLTTQVTIL